MNIVKLDELEIADSVSGDDTVVISQEGKTRRLKVSSLLGAKGQEGGSGELILLKNGMGNFTIIKYSNDSFTKITTDISAGISYSIDNDRLYVLKKTGEIAIYSIDAHSESILSFMKIHPKATCTASTKNSILVRNGIFIARDNTDDYSSILRIGKITDDDYTEFFNEKDYPMKCSVSDCGTYVCSVARQTYSHYLRVRIYELKNENGNISVNTVFNHYEENYSYKFLNCFWKDDSFIWCSVYTNSKRGYVYKITKQDDTFVMREGENIYQLYGLIPGVHSNRLYGIISYNDKKTDIALSSIYYDEFPSYTVNKLENSYKYTKNNYYANIILTRDNKYALFFLSEEYDHIRIYELQNAGEEEALQDTGIEIPFKQYNDTEDCKFHESVLFE